MDNDPINLSAITNGGVTHDERPKTTWLGAESTSKPISFRTAGRAGTEMAGHIFRFLSRALAHFVFVGGARRALLVADNDTPLPVLPSHAPPPRPPQAPYPGTPSPIVPTQSSPYPTGPPGDLVLHLPGRKEHAVPSVKEI